MNLEHTRTPHIVQRYSVMWNGSRAIQRMLHYTAFIRCLISNSQVKHETYTAWNFIMHSKLFAVLFHFLDCASFAVLLVVFLFFFVIVSRNFSVRARACDAHTAAKALQLLFFFTAAGAVATTVRRCHYISSMCLKTSLKIYSLEPSCSFLILLSITMLRRLILCSLLCSALLLFNFWRVCLNYYENVILWT